MISLIVSKYIFLLSVEKMFCSNSKYVLFLNFNITNIESTLDLQKFRDTNLATITWSREGGEGGGK